MAIVLYIRKRDLTYYHGSVTGCDSVLSSIAVKFIFLEKLDRKTWKVKPQAESPETICRQMMKKGNLRRSSAFLWKTVIIELITTYSVCRKVFIELAINQKVKKNLVGWVEGRLSQISIHALICLIKLHQINGQADKTCMYQNDTIRIYFYAEQL